MFKPPYKYHGRGMAWYCLLLLIPLFINGHAHGQEVIIIDEKTGKLPLGTRLMILEDPEKKLSITDVMTEETGRLFTNSVRTSPSYGFTRSAYWIKLTLRSKSSRPVEKLLDLDYPLMDSIALFTVDREGRFNEKKYGTLLPFSLREIMHRNFIFKLTVPPGMDTTLYMRFENTDRMEFPLTLWSVDAFQKHVYTEQFIIGLYYGILFVMLAYNLFLFFSLKARSYLYYVLYIFAMAVFQMGQNGYLYLLLSAGWDPPPVHFIPLTQAALIAAILHFSQSYLSTKKYAKLLHTIMNVLKTAALIYLPVSLFLDNTTSILIGVVITFMIIPVIILSGITVTRRGYRPAYYFMAAWSVMFVAGFLFLMRVIAVIPHNIFTNYILHIGTTIEVILLSLGLGDRYNLIREEREKISNELRIARNIQTSLIPREVPCVDGLSMYWEYIPMTEVGGDIFDYHVIDEKTLGVMVADVSGHGIPAALVASMVKVAFSLQRIHAEDPQKVISGMTTILKKDLAGTFITAGYACIDMKQRELTVSKCGHLPLYLYRRESREMIQLSPKGSFISSLPGSDIGRESVRIQSKDRIVMITDGIIECRNREGAMFGFDGFESFIREKSFLETRVFAKKLIETLGLWSHPAGYFNDDITLLVIDIV
jgi:hypothetical protein